MMAGWHLVLNHEDIHQSRGCLSWDFVPGLARVIRLWRDELAKAHRTRARKGQKIRSNISRHVSDGEAVPLDSWRKEGVDGAHKVGV